jgi:hypothetical protein
MCRTLSLYTAIIFTQLIVYCVLKYDGNTTSMFNIILGVVAASYYYYDYFNEQKKVIRNYKGAIEEKNSTITRLAYENHMLKRTKPSSDKVDEANQRDVTNIIPPTP